MNRDTGRVSPYVLAIFMLGCLVCYSSFPVYADELPASHPSCVTCKGTLSPQGRWCDNSNGTVTDMSTGLVWLKDAGWGGQYPFWAGTSDGTSAFDRATQVRNGNPASLKDDSKKGDWRLPTLKEFTAFVGGTEAISSYNMYLFINVQESGYWSSAVRVDEPLDAEFIDLYWGAIISGRKTYPNYVWPVRGGQ
ncbi:MAG: DUF1566 domain-containing protein [Deltaproteobacteria bacterium]|nr:DUF1566 domain-containing protein [Deltaproteobacteria bacterium]MBF0524886.1 DUF1566 domain-containing protein [Deltaproteobacteria bacterium]